MDGKTSGHGGIILDRRGQGGTRDTRLLNEGDGVNECECENDCAGRQPPSPSSFRASGDPYLCKRCPDASLNVYKIESLIGTIL